MWFKVCLFLLKYWKPIALFLAIALAAGWIYHKGSEAEQARQEAKEAKDREASLIQQRDDAYDALEAAKQARERNDTKLPETRRQTAARVDRALSADAAQRLLDDQEAVGAYAAAGSVLRGKGAD